MAYKSKTGDTINTVVQLLDYARFQYSDNNQVKHSINIEQGKITIKVGECVLEQLMPINPARSKSTL